MKILVTGGAGYIGSVVVEQLVQSGQEAVVFDNLVQGHRAAVHPEAVFVEGDLADPAAVAAVFREHHPDAVMHFASHIAVGESMQRPFKYLGENVTNGLNLLQAAVEHQVRRFILSSTAALFETPRRIPVAEDELIVPGSPYGESKHILERMLYWLDRTSGLRYAALRYFNAAGATTGTRRGPPSGDASDPAGLARGARPTRQRDHLRRRLRHARRHLPCGTTSTSCDLAQAHILALHALDRGSRIYNLGNGRGFSVREVLDTAREVTGRPIPALLGPRRPGESPCWSPPATRSSRNWAGSRNSPNCGRSSPAPGPGTSGTRRGTLRRPNRAPLRYLGCLPAGHQLLIRCAQA